MYIRWRSTQELSPDKGTETRHVLGSALEV